MRQQVFQELLLELQKLWQQLRSMFWASRLRHGESGHEPGPLRPLSEHIDLEAVAEKPAGDTEKAAGEGEAKASAVKGREKPFFNKAQGFFDELSRYLRTKRRARSLQPSLAEKLKKSTWEHVRTAARAAKVGDKGKAKLYADLADNAMKEAARYMPAADFKVFRQEVEDSLKAQFK